MSLHLPINQHKHSTSSLSLFELSVSCRRMATTAVENVTAKAEALVLQKATAIGEVAKENVGCENGTKVAEEQTATAELAKEKMNCENGTKVAEAEELSDERVQEDKEKTGNEVRKEEAKEDIAVEVEPKTGVSFPVKLNDGKQLNCVGLRKKSMLGLGIKIYGFGNVPYIKILVILVQYSALCTV